MRSRGGETGGLTLMEALNLFEEQGYTGQFAARPGGLVRCFSCRTLLAPENLHLDGVERVEGVSDPADMNMVGAMSCPHCGARGTATLAYGPNSPIEDGEVLRRLEASRQALKAGLQDTHEDASLVSDTGWIDRPRAP